MTSTTPEAVSNAQPSRAWLVRAGSQGEDEALALERGLAIVGFTFIPDLTGASNGSAVRELVSQASPEAGAGRISNWAGQLTSFVTGMQNGDIVALPLKTRPGLIALGRVKGSYNYREIDGIMRHTRQVEWVRQEIPRLEFEQDLLYSLGAFLTVCRIRRNGAERRIAAILAGSRDPGSDTSAESTGANTTDEEPVRDDHVALDISDIARQQIFEHIRSRFPGHQFARLVEAVLKAEGYSTWLSPAGPDGGVDILAGSGSLGFESPKLCVQVKATAGTVDVTVLRNLIGTMQTFKADQGILVSRGGFTSSLEREARQSFFTVRLWRAGDLVDALCRNYERLTESIQKEIPLEKVWTLVRDEGEL